MPPASEYFHDQSINLVMIEKFIEKHQLTFEEIGEFIPAFFHFNNPDLTVQYLNNNGCEWVEKSVEQINEMGYEFLKQYVHQDTLKYVAPRFLEFYRQQDTTKTICDFQKVYHPRKQEYVLCFTVTKISKTKPGFITITQPLENLPHSVQKIMRIIDEERFMRNNYTQYEQLTPREKEIIQLLLQGNNNPQIAEQLFISRRTVEQHRKNINQKLSITSFAQLYKFGLAFDLV